MRALLGVADRTGLVEFARGLRECGVDIIATDGTRRALAEAGIEATAVSDVTGFPEMLDGRVKTLHPAIHAGILARRDLPEHMAKLDEHGFTAIDIVVISLYPFVETVARGADAATTIENIDIGGPTMIRAAAKNSASVAVLVSPSQYDEVLAELRDSGAISQATRDRLAARAFAHTAAYDTAVAAYLSEQVPEREPAPPEYTTGGRAHRPAALRREPPPARRAVRHPRRARRRRPRAPAAGLGAELHQLARRRRRAPPGLRLRRARRGHHQAHQPVRLRGRQRRRRRLPRAPSSATRARRSAASSRSTARSTRPPPRSSPRRSSRRSWSPRSTPRRPRGSPRRSVCACSSSSAPRAPRSSTCAASTAACSCRSIDRVTTDRTAMSVPTQRQPDDAQWRDLLIAWRVCRHVKSNAIVIVRDGMAVGVGAGQMSRVEAAELAVQRAGDRVAGAVAASDAFFPMPDGLETLGKAGVVAVDPAGRVEEGPRGHRRRRRARHGHGPRRGAPLPPLRPPRSARRRPAASCAARRRRHP